jgi:hypothetical protein
MSDFAQYAALGRAMANPPAATDRPAPIRLSGLEALGRSSHGGAPITGGVLHDPIFVARALAGTHLPAPTDSLVEA